MQFVGRWRIRSAGEADGALKEIQRIRRWRRIEEGKGMSQEDLIARLTWAESMIQEASHHLLETIRMVDKP